MAEKKYILDAQKIRSVLDNQNRTLGWLSKVLGFGETWASDHVRKRRGVTEGELERILMVLDTDRESVLEIEETQTKQSGVGTFEYIAEFSEMYMDLKKLRGEMEFHKKVIERIVDQNDAIYEKLNTVVKQNARIKDSLGEIANPGRQGKAEYFLRNELKNGRMKVSSIKEDAYAIGITQDELMAAKKRLGINAEVGGNGANKDTYWYI